MTIIVIIGAILFFSFMIFLRIKMPEIKGSVGETKVSIILNRLPSDKYKIVNDVLLNTSRGTSQIDHVVLSEYGIFVIETKNYSGWIYGGENAEEWTKNIYGNKYNFRNPLKQNYAHVKALMEVLEITSQDLFIPIIAFSNRANIKVKSSKNIINFRALRRRILSYKNILLTSDAIQNYQSKLINCTNYTKDAKKDHVTEINENIKQRNIKIENGICPKCGGNLVKRKGKYGFFLGCSNYPRCHFIENL